MGTAVLILEAVATVAVATFIFRFLTSPLRNIPGPFIAKFTDLWSLYEAWGGKSDRTMRKLHDRYGPAVQYGPNRVSLSDPGLIKTVYSAKEKWPKSAFYEPNSIAGPGGKKLYTTFSTRDETWHTSYTKPILRVFNMKSVLRFEPLYDDTIQHFLSRLNSEFVSKKKPCPIDRWLVYFAWDVLGKVTFSKELGFLDQGKDVNNLIDTGFKAISYLGICGQMPWLDNYLDKNPVVRIGPPSFAPLAEYGVKLMKERLSGEDKHDPEVQTDFLDMFLDLLKNDPEVDEGKVTMWLVANLAAGSDTTAIEVLSCVYYLCRHPECSKKLQEELDAAGLRDSTPKQYKDLQHLPYLDAIVREAIRMHPANPFPLERTCPDSGFQLPDGRFLPGGTVVGIRSSITNRDPSVYGKDPDEFKPERWLRQPDESEEAFPSRTQRMKELDLTFGYGKRICTGRHVAMLEIYKVIATLFSAFDVKMVDPEKSWKVNSRWFAYTSGVDVWLEPRC